MNIKDGDSVDGEYVEKQNGEYLNKTLYKQKTWGKTVPNAYGPSKAQSGAYRNPSAINKAMDKKAENIQVAQDNKERGIMISSTLRMAVDIAIAEMAQAPAGVHSDIAGSVRNWRNWLIAEWSNIDSAPPFND